MVTNQGQLLIFDGVETEEAVLFRRQVVPASNIDRLVQLNFGSDGRPRSLIVLKSGAEVQVPYSFGDMLEPYEQALGYLVAAA